MADVMFIHLKAGGVCELRFVWCALQKARKFFSVYPTVTVDHDKAHLSLRLLRYKRKSLKFTKS